MLEDLPNMQRFWQRGVSVVVVDGGSKDNRLRIARKHAGLLLVAPCGRAAQMHAAAAATLMRSHFESGLEAAA